MKSFLSEVAEQLYGKYGDNLSDLVVLFPSQRARLFFCEALLDVVDKPIWAPQFVTIDELMSQISSLHSADRLRLISELYIVYSEYHKEDFDHFYHWGEMLVADFDMVDKYMVDAERLFVNIADIKEIEADLSYLTPEQEEYVRRFWSTLSSSMSLSKQKEYFLTIWRSLPEIYTKYKARLRGLDIGYTGMIYRDAAQILEESQSSPLAERRYVVAGFNALSNCEKALFNHLKNCYNADFFWDYSDYFVYNQMQEAGSFIRKNIEDYPSSFNISHRDLRKSIKSITVTSTATSAAQCKYVAQVLQQIAERDENGNIKPLDRNTAIVLTDENMLEPLLYALPIELKTTNAGSEGVNVTMGYPLRSTLAYSFVDRLLELQSHVREKDGEPTFYHQDIESLLTHPFLSGSDPAKIRALRKSIVEERIYNAPQSMLLPLPLGSYIFEQAADSTALLEYLDRVVTHLPEIIGSDDRLQIEYIVQIRKALQQLANMFTSCNITLTPSLTRSLVRRHLQSVRIPFEGEPLEGLQIMGILETRNIDFKNVIIMSMSDSNFPGTRIADSSSIPYSLRYAYGMPTLEHHQGVYAYYFYRLISRAENVWMTYCSTADEKGTGEPSRYIRQLEYESGMPITKLKVGVDVNLQQTESIVVEKDERTMERLSAYTSGNKRLSPTAFSTYVQCPMRFFCKYMAKINVEDELEEGLDDKTFGNIFHKSAELLYADAVGEANPLAVLEQIDEKRIVECVDRAIGEECFNSADFDRSKLQGELSIVRQIVIRYLKDNLIEYDKGHANFSVVALEDVFDAPFEFEVAGERKSVIFEGRADRVDSLTNGVCRIIDYKTGACHLVFKDFDKLFGGKDAERISNTINTLIYAMIARRRRGVEVQPALYYLREMYNGNYSPLLSMSSQTDKRKKTPIERYSDIAEQFEEHLSKTLAEMFDPKVPFRQAEDPLACTYCDYAAICSKRG